MNADNEDMIIVQANTTFCSIFFRDKEYKCSIGENGVINSELKVEGDGCTPTGVYQLRRGFYRKDRISRKIINSLSDVISFSETFPNYGWCDSPIDDMYNQFINLPYNASHEFLWLKESHAYDLMAVIGYNDNPVVPYKGSAIFFHVTETYSFTAGCVAMSLNDLSYILSVITMDTKIQILQS